MPMPYPEKTNVGVLVNVQRRLNENLRPETVQWLAEVIQAGLLGRKQGGSTKIEVDEKTASSQSSVADRTGRIRTQSVVFRASRLGEKLERHLYS
jgi:hypothetical protein